MNNLKWGIVILAVIVVVAIFFQFRKKPKLTDQNPGLSLPTETLSATLTPAPPSQYSDEVRAKVRSDFINTCHTQGKYEVSVCNCAADYLADNYSETELAKMYVQYHSTKNIPSALEKAADKCLVK